MNFKLCFNSFFVSFPIATIAIHSLINWFTTIVIIVVVIAIYCSEGYFEGWDSIVRRMMHIMSYSLLQNNLL